MVTDDNQTYEDHFVTYKTIELLCQNHYIYEYIVCQL